MKKLFCVISATLVLTGCKTNEPYIIPAAEGLELNVETGGPNEPSQVFVDLETGDQAGVARNSWDLGFSSGATFRVIMNTSSDALVKPLDKNDLTMVTADDTVGLGSMLSYDAIFAAVVNPPAPTWVAESINWVDDATGDLKKTAINEISSTDANNQVYIINRGKNPDGTQRGWLKFRVLQSGNGYDLQYAEINSTEYQVISIAKDPAYNFSFVNFDLGMATVEPEKSSWEISFTTYFEILNFGTDFPYSVKDFVLLNRNAVSASEVVLESGQDLATEYDAFSLSDATGLTFQTDINSIGSNWRTVASPTPGSVTGVKSDRFYVIKNGSENYFKLIFTAMLNNQGERGYPQIKFKLLQ